MDRLPHRDHWMFITSRVALALTSIFVLFLLVGCDKSKAGESVTEARAAFESGDYARATEVLESVLENNPDNREARSIMGSVLTAKGENEAAISFYAESVKRNPKDHDSLYRMALIERLIGRSEDAVTHLEAAVEIEPSRDYLDELARTYMQVGRFADAAAAWGRILDEKDAITDVRVNALRMQAEAYMAAKNYDAARVSLKEALKLAPNDKDINGKLEALKQ